MDPNSLAIILSAVAIALSIWVFSRTQDAERIREVDESTDGGYYQHRGFMDAGGVEIDGAVELSLRGAKKRAFESRMALESELGAENAAREWTAQSGYEAAGKPWNVVAFNLAEMLTLTGTRCFVGSASLGATLIHVGDTIVQDWLVCREWVESYRSFRQVWARSLFPDVPWHRREGEWLALVAVLYLDDRWSYQPARLVVEHCGGRRAVERRVLALSDPDRSLLSRGAIRDIAKLCSKRLAWSLRLIRWAPTRRVVARLSR